MAAQGVLVHRGRLGDGTERLAAGPVDGVPAALLEAEATLDDLLARGGGALEAAARQALAGGPPVPDGWIGLAPVRNQEVWAAGVTYERSRDARMEESVTAASVYDAVYDAARPELFFKAAGWRVRGPGEAVGVRADSTWDVPEPELALVLDAAGQIAGLTVGNDVSSRSIEGENPLYLPQAKAYTGACALGPAILVGADLAEPFAIELQIDRGPERVFTGAASTADLRRGLDELAGYLFRALEFPVGAVLMTGTTLVPDPPFTLRAGDHVRIDVPRIGRLANPVELVGRS